MSLEKEERERKELLKMFGDSDKNSDSRSKSKKDNDDHHTTTTTSSTISSLSQLVCDIILYDYRQLAQG